MSVSGQSGLPSTPAIAALDRLALQCAYLRDFWPDHVRVRGGSPIQPLSEEDVASLADRVSKDDGLGSARPWLLRFRRHALLRLGLAEENVYGTPGVSVAPCLLEFRCPAPDEAREVVRPGPFAQRFLVVTHDILVLAEVSARAARARKRPLQVAKAGLFRLGRRKQEEESRLPPALGQELKEARSRTERSIEKLARTPASTGDLVSAHFALEGFALLLSDGLRSEKLVEGSDPWPSLLASLGGSLGGYLRRLAGLDPLLSAASARLAAEVIPPAAPRPIGIMKGVLRRVGRLDDFSRELLLARGPERPKEPFRVGDISTERIRRLRLISSPALGGSLTPDLRKILGQELESYERKLFGMTVRPRPRLFLSSLEWTGTRIILDESDPDAPSEASAAFMVLAHNILQRQVELWQPKDLMSEPAALPADPAEDRVPEEEETPPANEGDVIGIPLKRLLECRPTGGDLAPIHLGMIGLRNALLRVKGSGVQGGWRKLFEVVSPEVREAILSAAPYSPPLLIAESDLETAAREHEEAESAVGLGRFRFLKILLEDPAALASRRAAMVALLKRALDGGAEGRRDMLGVVSVCMGTAGHCGLEFAGELLDGLFERLCGEVSRSIWALRTLLRMPRTSESCLRGAREKLTRSEVALRRWLFDPADDHVKELQRVLVEFLTRSRTDRLAFDGRLTLGDWWERIARRATEGFGARPWGARPRRVLCLFWLQLCVRAGEEGIPLSVDIGNGSGGRESWEVVGPRFFRELERDAELRARRRKQLHKLGRLSTGSDSEVGERTAEERNEDLEIHIVSAYLKSFETDGQPEEKPGPFRRALLVHDSLASSEEQSPEARQLDQIGAQKP